MKKNVFVNKTTMYPTLCRRTALLAALIMLVTGIRFFFLTSPRDMSGVSVSAVLSLASLTVFVLTSKRLRTRRVSRYIVNGIFRIGAVAVALGGLAVIGFMTKVYVPWLLKGVAIDDVLSHLAFVFAVVVGVAMILLAKEMWHIGFNTFVSDQEIDPYH